MSLSFWIDCLFRLFVPKRREHQQPTTSIKDEEKRVLLLSRSRVWLLFESDSEGWRQRVVNRKRREARNRLERLTSVCVRTRLLESFSFLSGCTPQRDKLRAVTDRLTLTQAREKERESHTQANPRQRRLSHSPRRVKSAEPHEADRNPVVHLSASRSLSSSLA